MRFRVGAGWDRTINSGFARSSGVCQLAVRIPTRNYSSSTAPVASATFPVRHRFASQRFNRSRVKTAPSRRFLSSPSYNGVPPSRLLAGQPGRVERPLFRDSQRNGGHNLNDVASLIADDERQWVVHASGPPSGSDAETSASRPRNFVAACGPDPGRFPELVPGMHPREINVSPAKRQRHLSLICGLRLRALILTWTSTHKTRPPSSFCSDPASNTTLSPGLSGAGVG